MNESGEMKVMKESKSMLRIKKKMKKKKPEFKRQEGYRMKKLKKSWRRPRGRHSKLRKQEKAKGTTPRVGYGSPKSARGLTRYGYIEVRVSALKDIERIDKSKEIALISSTVGKKKRAEMLKKADELKIKVSNPKV